MTKKEKRITNLILKLIRDNKLEKYKWISEEIKTKKINSKNSKRGNDAIQPEKKEEST